MSLKEGDGEGWSTHGTISGPRHFTYWRAADVEAVVRARAGATSSSGRDSGATGGRPGSSCRRSVMGCRHEAHGVLGAARRDPRAGLLPHAGPSSPSCATSTAARPRRRSTPACRPSRCGPPCTASSSSRTPSGDHPAGRRPHRRRRPASYGPHPRRLAGGRRGRRHHRRRDRLAPRPRHLRQRDDGRPRADLPGPRHGRGRLRARARHAPPRATGRPGRGLPHRGDRCGPGRRRRRRRLDGRAAPRRAHAGRHHGGQQRRRATPRPTWPPRSTAPAPCRSSCGRPPSGPSPAPTSPASERPSPAPWACPS